jgi:hypothetical protein
MIDDNPPLSGTEHLKAVRDSFRGGVYQEDILLQAAQKIAALTPKNQQEAIKNKCNSEAIYLFCKMRQLSASRKMRIFSSVVYRLPFII